MPTYDFRCPDGHVFEVFQKMSDDPVRPCPECGQDAARQISGGAGLKLSGGSSGGGSSWSPSSLTGGPDKLPHAPADLGRKD